MVRTRWLNEDGTYIVCGFCKSKNIYELTINRDESSVAIEETLFCDRCDNGYDFITNYKEEKK